MKKHIIALSLGLIVSTSAFAESAEDIKKQQKRNEAVGFGSGIVVGAAIGGPAGAAIAGLIGLLIADDVNDEQKLARAQDNLNIQQQQMASLNDELLAVKQHAQVQLVSMEKHVERVLQSSNSSIQFRTASAEIEPHYQESLNLVAENAIDNPEVKVVLSGYADQRGDNSYNQSLSRLRVEAVKEYLLNIGVGEEQVLTYAYGENKPVAQNSAPETHFFDRRVVVKVAPKGQVLTASN